MQNAHFHNAIINNKQDIGRELPYHCVYIGQYEGKQLDVYVVLIVLLANTEIEPRLPKYVYLVRQIFT